MWPFAAWGLPIFLVLRGFIGDGGGWESLFLLLASPLLVPAAGLLGMLPRFLLRRKGVRSAPAPIAAVLFVHWWSWIAFSLTLEGSGDSGPTGSLLRNSLDAPLSRDAEDVIFFGALVLAAATWLVILSLASLYAKGPTVPVNPGWTRAAWITAVAAPVAFALAVGAATASTGQQRDAAGETVAEAEQRSIAEQADRAVALHDEAQGLLTPLRGAIAETGWSLRSAGFTGYEAQCEARAAECYGFHIGYASDVVLDNGETARLAEILRAEGWDVSEGTGSLEAERPNGFELEVDLYPKGTWIYLTTPTWWGEAYDIRQELEARVPVGGERAETFAFDEWPPLR